MIAVKRWAAAIALFIAMILDGTLALLFRQVANLNSSFWLVAIGLMVLSLDNSDNHKLIWLALGLGVIADSYYIGIFGIYTLILPLIVFATQRLANEIPEIFWVRLLVIIIEYSLANLYVFLALQVTGVVQLSFQIWAQSLLPNVLSAILMTLVSYPFWRWLARVYPFLDHHDSF